MTYPKFTFELPEAQIPPDVPEEFKEYAKRQMQYVAFGYLAPTMSFEKFKEIMSKRRKGTTKPENVYPIVRSGLFDMIDEYLKDE